jgi:hypothetical protein
MLEKSLVKMLSENKAIVTIDKNKRLAKVNGQVITWIEQDGKALVAVIRKENDSNDMLVDYFAGSHFYTLKTIYKKLFC